MNINARSLFSGVGGLGRAVQEFMQLSASEATLQPFGGQGREELLRIYRAWLFARPPLLQNQNEMWEQ